MLFRRQMPSRRIDAKNSHLSYSDRIIVRCVKDIQFSNEQKIELSYRNSPDSTSYSCARSTLPYKYSINNDHGQCWIDRIPITLPCPSYFGFAVDDVFAWFDEFPDTEDPQSPVKFHILPPKPERPFSFTFNSDFSF